MYFWWYISSSVGTDTVCTFSAKCMLLGTDAFQRIVGYFLLTSSRSWNSRRLDIVKVIQGHRAGKLTGTLPVFGNKPQF